MNAQQNQEIKRKYNISWEKVARVNYLPIFKMSGRTDVRTDGRTDGRMDRETWKLKYYFRFEHALKGSEYICLSFSFSQIQNKSMGRKMRLVFD